MTNLHFIDIKSSLRKKIKSMPKHAWVLLIIVLVGAFLRTYHFHDWLEFRDDQTRDSILVGKVVTGETSWPLLGPKMNFTGATEAQSFHLGPMYYYFQIISAKIFGNYPDKFAYPDLFFNILSIPLLYLFLSVYFRRYLALGLVSLYAISPYFIHYSRFAWNSNLIPFFVLLFLFALVKFLRCPEKNNWKWSILVGIAWAVGFQLHAILMLLFSAVIFLVFLFSIKNNTNKIFWQWLLILVVFLVLNGGQIVSELQTNFSNTKILLNFSKQSNGATGVSKLDLVANDLDCHAEANFHFLTSYNSDNCTYDLAGIADLSKLTAKTSAKFFKNLTYEFSLLVSIVFSFLGYGFLVYYARKETVQEKKYFLYLIILYSVIAFIVMIPLSLEKFSDLRYFVQIFFVPYLLLGFFVKFLAEKLSLKYVTAIASVLFMILVYTNVTAAADDASALLAENRTCSSHFTALGELEPVAEYIAANSDGQTVYFGGDKSLPVVFTPLQYLLKTHNLDSVDIGIRSGNSSQEFDGPSFYVSCKSGLKDNYPIYKEIGNIYVFQMKK